MKALRLPLIVFVLAGLITVSQLGCRPPEPEIMIVPK